MGMLERQNPMVDRITNGRTDLVFDFVGAGQPATFCDAGGAKLISTCAYYGDVSAIRFLLSQGERLESLGPNLALDAAAFHGHWHSARRIGPDAVWRSTCSSGREPIRIGRRSQESRPAVSCAIAERRERRRCTERRPSPAMRRSNCSSTPERRWMPET
jgi:hypothetical protein